MVKHLVQEVKSDDILKIEKPNKNIYVYINPIHNYTIEEFRPISSKSFKIFVFNRNISEEYNASIYISSKAYDYELTSKFGLFYGNLENYEYNQLINSKMQIQISNNPYKYIQEDDESKYFFLISQMNGQDSLNIIKLREKEVILNELNLVERYDNEYMKVKFPKVNEERVIAFIQYFNTSLYIYDGGSSIPLEKRGEKYEVYIFEKGMEPFGDDKKTLAYKSYFFVSYINYTDNININEYLDIPKDCEFTIKEVSDSKDEIKIKYETLCSSTMYNYFVFIDYNTSNTTNYDPIQLFYEKDNNTDIKYYKVQKKGSGNSLKISDSFIIGDLNIIVVGQDTQGFNRFVYAQTRYYYEGNDDSNHTLIIVLSILGGICLLVAIIISIRCIRKKLRDSDLESNKAEKLFNQKIEETNPDFLAYVDQK